MLQGLIENLNAYLQTSSPAALLAALVAGIFTSFTPCVYPLLPITITFIGAKSANSTKSAFVLSLFYALGIAVTYAILGMAAGLTGSIFGQWQNSPWVFLAIGNICLLLGLNIIGAFNLPLPNFVKRIPQTKTGWLGSFLMGLVAGLVMGPCTAPVLAVLLAYVATKQSVWFGGVTMFIFAIGLNTVLVLAGTFAGILTKFPKPGVWMERVKKTMGWGLIVIAEYFLVQVGKTLI